MTNSVVCNCFFCSQGKKHYHVTDFEWIETNGILLVAESLKPEDTLRVKACTLCGHEELLDA
jgi:hypothetical protein